MTARRAVPERVPPVFRLPCWHPIPYPAQRFLDLWPGDVELLCLYCGKFQPVIRRKNVTDVVALVTPPMI